MAEVVIIGAGLTGLSTAYHLEKTGFHDYKIFERNATVGGLARSVKHDGFTFDYTGHLIHINDTYFQSFMNDVVDLSTLGKCKRNSFVHSYNTFTPFPFQMNLHGLPTSVITECIQGFVNRKTSLRNPTNFRQWVYKYFGAGIAKHFFFPYNGKILAYDLSKVHPSWTGRFVPQTTLKDLLQGALEPASPDVGYNKTFYYPKKHGIQHFCNSIERRVSNPINFNHTVDRIDFKNKVVRFTNGEVEKYKHLVTTLPLNHLLRMADEPSNSSLKNAKSKLICNAVVNFNLGINIENFTDKHWIYFPEKKYPFYRLGFWHNFSKDLVPAGCSSLYGEIAHIPGTKTDRQLNGLVARAKKETLKLFGLSAANLVTEKVLNLNHAYVIYDHWRQKNLTTLLQRLEDLDVQSTGRFGHWKYSSMQEAILDGKQAAEKCVEKLMLFSEEGIKRPPQAHRAGQRSSQR